MSRPRSVPLLFGLAGAFLVAVILWIYAFDAGDARSGTSSIAPKDASPRSVPGEQPTPKEVRAAPVATRSRAEGDSAPVRLEDLEIVLEDGEGQPLSGWVRIPGEQDALEVPGSGLALAIERPATVHAWAVGYLPETAEVSPAETECRLVLRRGRSVEIRAVDTRDQPIPGVHCVVCSVATPVAAAVDHAAFDPGPGHRIQEGRSAADGVARISGLPSGETLFFSVSKFGWIPVTKPEQKVLTPEATSATVTMRRVVVAAVADSPSILSWRSSTHASAGAVGAAGLAALSVVERDLRRTLGTEVLLAGIASETPPRADFRLYDADRGVVETSAPFLPVEEGMQPWTPSEEDFVAGALPDAGYARLVFYRPDGRPLELVGGEVAIVPARRRRSSWLLPVKQPDARIRLGAGEYRLIARNRLVERAFDDLPAFEVTAGGESSVTVTVVDQVRNVTLRARRVSGLAVESFSYEFSDGSSRVGGAVAAGGEVDVMLPDGRYRLRVQAWRCEPFDRSVQISDSTTPLQVTLADG